MSEAIEFAGSTINCLIRNISISEAALDVTPRHPRMFDLVKADIPCHIIWRRAEQIGMAFDWYWIVAQAPSSNSPGLDEATSLNQTGLSVFELLCPDLMSATLWSQKQAQQVLLFLTHGL